MFGVLNRSYCSGGDLLNVKIIGEGKPVILLHGFGMNNNHWIPFAYPFSKKFQFIIPDLRGFGKNCHLYRGYEDSLVNHAEDIFNLITELKLSNVHLMGYSLGGLIALQYIKSFGCNGLSKLTLMDVSPSIHPDKNWDHPIFGSYYQKRISSWFSLQMRFKSVFGHSSFSEVSFEDLPDRYRRRVLLTLGRFLSDAVHQKWVKNIILRSSIKGDLLGFVFPMECWHVFADHSRSFTNNEYDFRQTIQESTIPLDIISGFKSGVFPFLSQKRMADLSPYSQQMIQLNSGHMIMFDEPIEFFRNLKRTLISNL